MRKLSVVFIGLLMFCLSFRSVADEGMWLPLFVERLNYVDMQKMGLKLTPEEIYSINQSSLKDAIIQFGGGCTGEIVSAEGLLFTNHHCGYGAIQSHSTVEHDYLSNGFAAMKRDEELSNPGLTARFLVRIEDVTQKVLSQLDSKLSEPDRAKKVDEIGKTIVSDAIKGTHYEASVRSFFAGNEYYLFVFEVFRDVRLVFAPPSSIGKFGADTDNWMWPRHTGDFAVFRVYTGPDGKPADYSSSNIPLKPKHFLKISLDGVQEGDFAMIMGFPGRTSRYLTSHGVNLAIAESNPAVVKIRDKKLKLMMEDMQANPEIRIKYASKYAGISNYWKYFIGQTEQLKNNMVADKKVKQEESFTQWLNTHRDAKAKYGEVLTGYADVYKQVQEFNLIGIYNREAILRGPEIIGFTRGFEDLAKALKDQDQAKITELSGKLNKGLPGLFKNYNGPTDQKLMAAMFEMYFNDIPKNQQPAIMAEINKKYKGNFEKFAADIFTRSVFASQTNIEKFLDKPSLKTLENDLVYRIMKDFSENARNTSAKTEPANQKMEQLNRLYIAGLREMNPDRKFYPDANSTMRLTYGQVLDYDPRDGVNYKNITTLKGVMEKEDPNNWEFVVPEKLKMLYDKKDYGRYGQNGEMVTCFLSNNDITGGNSGSPVLNANGDLIGIAFDGNWEAMSGDISYEPNLQRTISVDIRYVLFIIDKYGDAGHLIKELVIR